MNSMAQMTLRSASKLVPRVPDTALSATLVGIDDFALGFVQTYIAEHFATATPTLEQIEAALRALENFGGHHGLQARCLAELRAAPLSVEAVQGELSKRGEPKR